MIALRSEDEIRQIKEAGKILSQTIDKLKKHLRDGVETGELDRIAREEILKRNGYPAFKGYRGFPGNICVSLNEAVVHGIPSERQVRPGDIVSIDIGVKFRDYYADAAVTIGVGEISDTAKRLIDTARKALYIGIENAVSGRRLSDISSSIQVFVEASGFSVVRALVGHGIGKQIHEEPEVPNFGKPGTGPELKMGMVLAIEPMINAGAFEVEVLDDGWTVVTKDRRLSAHFEHTVVVREGRAEILTE
ncbi:MAG: type I methionyl aminopeptidase [Candidatus Omnitrophota bacterium]|nr:type I methionyl aminopeptidase [Candidatus Omnitrophota bacterium]